MTGAGERHNQETTTIKNPSGRALGLGNNRAEYGHHAGTKPFGTTISEPGKPSEVVEEKMVGTVRFELTTSSTPRKRATKLRYVPTTKPPAHGAPAAPTSSRAAKHVSTQISRQFRPSDRQTSEIGFRRSIAHLPLPAQPGDAGPLPSIPVHQVPSRAKPRAGFLGTLAIVLPEPPCVPRPPQTSPDQP